MKTAIFVDSPALLSIPEVAWLLGVANSQVCRMIRIGLLPVVRRRSRTLVPAHALAHLADVGDDCRTGHSAGRDDRSGGKP
jgi:uncharacterized protein